MSDGAPSRSPDEGASPSQGASPSAGAPPSRRARAWERLNGPTRIAGIDLARGLAIIGMFTAHLITRPALQADPATWIAIVDGRSSILFATLAGVSIGLVTGGATVLEAPALRVARQRLAVRGCLLWLLGIALIATGVPVMVILPAYGILFLLAVPFTRLGARPLLDHAPPRPPSSCPSCRSGWTRPRTGRHSPAADSPSRSAGTIRSRCGSHSCWRAWASRAPASVACRCSCGCWQPAQP